MTSIIKFSCISGGDDGSPSCYLLQIDQFKCLLDCGWDEKFSQNIVDEIGVHFKSLNAILITYPDPAHLGALPYLVKHYGLPCKIYATRPVTQMGLMFMTDLLLSRLNNQEFDLYSQEDINKAFESDNIVHLNYNQTYHLEGPGSGLTITPLAAGHMVGGTIWKIVKDNEEDIVYAVDYNHKKERHLNGCVLDTITRPSLLITDAFNALNHQSRMRERDQKFLSTIIETLRGGGNILIACDTAGRVLEIAHMLDNFWRRKDNGVSAYSLALVNNVASRMIDITMSTIEWMSENILREFETSRDNPFKFKYLQLKQHLSDLEHLPQPITVIASQPDLESGFAKDLFAIWSRDPKNSIIFTQRPGPNSLGHQVMNTPSRVIQVEIWQRIELDGEELEDYKKKEEERKQQELIESQKKLAINDSDSDNDSLDETMVSRTSRAMAHHQPSKHDLMMVDEFERGTVFFKQARKTYPMFPAPTDKKILFDDYGEQIDPQDYVLIHKMQGSNKLLEVEGENKENGATRTNEAEAEEEVEAEVKPTKCVSIVATLNVQAKLHYFDFEGRSDGESVKNLVSQVKPRRLILVRGSPESTAYMADYCRAYVDNRILQPKTGETIDATTENYIYQVKLKDSLVSSLNFHTTTDGVELAWVDAKTQMPEEDDELVSDKLPCLDTLEFDQVPLHNALFINELRLSDFKQILINNGIQAEFSGGVLYCNERVTVRRKETGGRGRIHIEGTLCDDYFKIRNLLYQQYIVI